MDLTRRRALAALASPAVAGTAPGGGLPKVRIGGREFSRLIVGGNPVSGNSHQPGGASREMRDYFTAENTKKMLRACEEAGINTWQSRGDRHILRLLNEYRLEGGRLQWVAQTASELADIPRNIRECAAAYFDVFGYHPYGYDQPPEADPYQHELTFRRVERVRDLLKVMRDAGVLAGIGTHIPEVVDYVESKNWDFDFHMTSIYNLSRPREEAAKLAGKAVDGELFWDPDREAMLRRVRQASKPCFIFKVYAAGR